MATDNLLEQLHRNIQDVWALRDELEKETDRGCSLLASSFLDNWIQKLLRAKLVGSKSTLDPLFALHGPLSSFSARSKMCYSVGLISKNTYDDIDKIRKIRNEFGHSHLPITFETPEIRNRVLALKDKVYLIEATPIREVFVNVVMFTLAVIFCNYRDKPKFKEDLYDENHDAKSSMMTEEDIKRAVIAFKNHMK